MKGRTVIILAGIVIALIFFNEFVLNNKSASQNKVAAVSGNSQPQPSSSIATSGTNTSTGEAAIGGNFSLTDQNNKKFTETNLNGRYSLVYFGFTNCPMICPTTLSNITLALNEIKAAPAKLQVIFITTDPERDTPARQKEFLANFPYPITGLTGTESELAKAREEYKAYAEKLSPDKAGNYDMTHTSIIYIMDKNGKFIDHLSYESTVADIVTKIKKLDL